MSRRKQLLAVLCVGSVASLVGWATVTEPKGLRGDALSQHPTARAFADAERQWFARFDLQPTERFIELRGPKLRARVLELAGDGPAVVMVHGGGGVAAQWAPLAAELRGHHLFLVDRPGCGLTDGFDYDGVDLRAHAVSFVSGVLDGLGLQRAVLVGNSMGGLWSLWFSAAQPERVEALVLTGTPALFLGTSAPVPMRLMSVPGLGQTMMRLQPTSVAATRSTLSRVLGDSAVAKADPQLFELASAANQIPGARRSFRTLIAQALSPMGANPRYAFSTEEFTKLRTPTLWVYGQQDVFGNATVVAAARAARPDLVVETFPGGHLPWFDDAARTGASVRAFLDTRVAATR